MPAVFDRLGIRFVYPDNWTLDEQNLEGGRAVSVSSPGGAFWSLTIHPAAADVAELAAAVLAGLRQAYDNLDVEAVVEVMADQEMIGYDVNFYCLDLTNTAQVRGFQNTAATYMMLWQAEDREYAEVQPVFQAITVSLIQATAQEEV